MRSRYWLLTCFVQGTQHPCSCRVVEDQHCWPASLGMGEFLEEHLEEDTLTEVITQHQQKGTYLNKNI